MDKLTPERRSANMRAIRSKGMKPEMAVRRLTHALGYRFRLHQKDLPGKPDLVFSGRRKAIFVHGCFWHQHANCRDGRPPTSNTGYWTSKLARNAERDQRNVELLQKAGWDVLTIWECEIADQDRLKSQLADFLGPARLKTPQTPHSPPAPAAQSPRF